MTTQAQSTQIQQLSLYAAAAATCADRYAKAFYPMIRDADEKMVCCVHGAEDMEHYISAAEVLRGLGVDLGSVVDRPISERGLYGADVLETTASWPERAVFSAVFERALLAQLRELARSTCAPIAKMAGSAVAREERHAAHGLELLRKACGVEEGRAQAQHAVRRIWPVALAAIEEGGPRQAFADAMRDELGALGLSVPE
ncbi:uncharacterized protein SOCEGT47_023610 [Sorangium cellulosum]|jgi:1,2-phenylacetyl-CoA epoxidase catalytic subunit|uniref:Uncharacterized protein n=1 Tax=Sorangium cellulosum TaxID=56 RepID=A0A4P2PYA7_SORCE|nr:Phenylacetic acid catabolic protein [Sorangium cellulosum]AUX21865.1 uncharacterized protein SOCEGT47_023610 [Sorangium cellulosum]